MSEEQATDNKKAAKRIITIIDNYRMRLEAPNPKGGERPAALSITFIGDNPRFNLYTNVESDPRKGYLGIRINIRTLRRLMNLILSTAAGESPNGNTIKNHHNYDAEGNFHETPVHVSTFIVGKEEDGRIYLAAHASGYTPVKFHFEQDPYHHICNRKGEPLPVSEVSPMIAKDYADLVNECTPMSLHEVAMSKGVATDAPVKAAESDDPSVAALSTDPDAESQRRNNYNNGGNRNNYNNNRGNYNNNRGGYNNNRGGGNKGNYNNNRGNYNNGGNRNNYNNGGGNGGGSFKREQNTDFDTQDTSTDGDSLEF